MKILVLGATGGSGRIIVSELLSRGHDVTAFVRRASSFESPRVRLVVGDATNSKAVFDAVQGHDAVVVALGISENAVRVRLQGPQATPMHIRSVGTRYAIDAMRAAGVRKLIVQSTYGIGDTHSRLSLKWRILFWLLLKPQIEDTEIQEQYVKSSELDWIIIRPVGLTDNAHSPDPLVSSEGSVRSMQVSRQAVARVISDNIERDDHVGQYLCVSA